MLKSVRTPQDGTRVLFDHGARLFFNPFLVPLSAFDHGSVNEPVSEAVTWLVEVAN